jgi:predicted dehydrogenase
MEKINWGIIGPGSIAEVFADALTVSDKGQLYAVASRNVERARVFAEKYNAVEIYNSYQTLIDDPNVDIIYIATPQSHHYQQAKLCLQAGKALLMEKPCTVNAKQIAALIELSQRKGVFFQEALWSRFMPCFTKIKQWIENGEIGELQYIT